MPQLSPNVSSGAVLRSRGFQEERRVWGSLSPPAFGAGQSTQINKASDRTAGKATAGSFAICSPTDPCFSRAPQTLLFTSLKP